MGLSSSKQTTVENKDPWAPAQPYILNGLASTQGVFDHNQPQLQRMGDIAGQAYDAIAPEALRTSDFAKAAQAQAQAISGGQFLGRNPGAATYARLQQPGTDPTVGLLQGLAQPGATNSYAGIGTANPAIAQLQRLQGGGTNLALSGLQSIGASGGGIQAPTVGTARVSAGSASSRDIAARDVTAPTAINASDNLASKAAQGAYLDAQPSAGFYKDVLAGKYLNGSPYLDSIVQQGSDAATKAVNARFAASGMGEGISTPYAGLLSRSVADSANALRYQDYSSQLDRMAQVGGQSDAAFAAERGQMSNAIGQIAANYQANADRQLQAATGNADRALQAGSTNAANRLDADKFNVANALQAQTTNAANGLTAAQDNARNIVAAQEANGQQRLSALGLLSDASNRQFDNQLNAGTALGTMTNQTGQLKLAAQQAQDGARAAARANQINAANALGGRFDAASQTQLAAAQAGDAGYNSQIAQILQALGLTGELGSAQYAGVAPALSLLSEAASIPYVGVGALNGNITGLTSGYGVQTNRTSSSPSLWDQLQQGVGTASSLVGLLGKKGK